MSGNNAWFEQNCDPDDIVEEQEAVASGGGNIGSPTGGPAPNTVTSVLENLIGQCYGELTPVSPNFPGDGDPDDIDFWDFDWESIFPSLIGIDWPVPRMGKIRVYLPTLDNPNGGDICYNEYGEEISCDKDKNKDLEDCIKNHLDCLFKPFVGGAWKPPKADCDSFVPQSMFGVTKKICVRDCVTERIGVYQHVLGGTPTATASFSDKDTITVTGTGTCLVTLEHRWKDQEWTAGTAVDTIAVGGVTFTRSGTRGKTTNTLSLTAGNYPITYGGLHPTGGYNIETNVEYGTNKTVVFRDGHGSDVNGRFSILSSNIASDHMYSISSSAPGGYVAGNIPHFYGHPTQQSRGSVPVYISYSSTKVDHMLTTDPAGEKATMDSQGFGSRDSILFYGFSDKQDMISELLEGEKPAPLYRYYSPDSDDHMYTLTPIGGPPITANLAEGYYELHDKAETYLNFTFNCRQGSASYDNSMGWYVTNDDGVPIHGRVLLENATDASGRFNFKVPADELNQYIPCKLGFFMIPDGQGRGAPHGTACTFSTLNDGYRIDQSSSAQSNYVFFSQNELNPGDKEMTKWPDRSWQYWEDLLNGDDDYNDMKISYHLRYGDSEYFFEGIQCYVFRNDASPEYADITTIDKCEDRVFESQIESMAMTRTECGRVDSENNYGCSNCTGPIAFSKNTTQHITAVKNASLAVRSHGGMTGGWGECTKFTWTIEKNGVQIIQQQSNVAKWLKIGSTLATFNVVKGDRITFKLNSIDVGHYNGRCTPAMSMRNEATGEFLFTWDMALTTISNTYRNNNPAQNDGNLTTQEPTEPCGLPVSVQLFNYEDTGNDYDKVNYTTVMTTKTVQNNVLQVRGADQTNELQVIGRTSVRDMNNGDTGFINTNGEKGFSFKLKWTVHDAANAETDWELVEILDWGQGGFDVNDEMEVFVGKWPEDDDSNFGSYYLGMKVTAINDIECPSAGSNLGQIQDISLEAQQYQEQSSPRQLNIQVINNQSIQANEFILNMDSIFGSFFRYKTGKAQSFHEYWLQQSLAGQDVLFYNDYKDKDRGLHFRLRIRVTRQDNHVSGDPYKFKRYGWFGQIKIDQVFNYGKGYETGKILEVAWPPTQVQYTNGKEPQSPYFPKQTNLPKKVQVRDATNRRYKRNARYAIYQSAHDKGSQIWYSNQNAWTPTQQRWIDILATEVS